MRRNLRFRHASPIVAIVAAALCAYSAPAAAGSLHHYQLTLENLSPGQPLSPPVAATHSPSVVMFRVGQEVSGELEILAENGDPSPLYWLFRSLDRVSDVVNLGVPLTPAGSTAGGFSDHASFTLSGRSGDRLSLASMLVCTNDGITGIDRMRLPRGARTLRLVGLDAGTEDNTELSGDLPDPCSALGPMHLPGDPNGNENTAVDSMPHQRLARHDGLSLSGDLSAAHEWSDPVARLTVVRLADSRSRHFSAELSGFAEVPPASSDGWGSARFELKRDGTLKYALKVRNLGDATAAHIHLGNPGVNGPVVAPLYRAEPAKDRPRVRQPPRSDHDEDEHDDDGDDEDEGDDELEVEGRIGVSDLMGGPFENDFQAFVAALGDGALYVNVHSPTYPGGELRGQVGADD